MTARDRRRRPIRDLRGTLSVDQPRPLAIAPAVVTVRGMRITPLLLVVALAGACSEPILKNAPRPPASHVAGVAAAAATAVTLANPDAAAHKREEAQRAGAPPPRIHAVHETVPADVLDRLDHARPDTPTPLVAPQP